MASSISVSNTGQYMVISFIASGILISSDYGLSWGRIENSPNRFWSVVITDSNKYIIGGSSKTPNSSVWIGKLQSEENTFIFNNSKKEEYGKILYYEFKNICIFLLIYIYLYIIQILYFICL